MQATAAKSRALTDDPMYPAALETLVAGSAPCSVAALVTVGIGAVGDPFIDIKKVLEGTPGIVAVGVAVLPPPPITFGAAELELFIVVLLPRVVAMSLAALVSYWDMREAQLELSKLIWNIHTEAQRVPSINVQQSH